MIESFKEYFNLNENYLKISHSDQKISLVSFNSITLDGIMFQFDITIDDLKKNPKYNNMSLKNLYEKIIYLIDKKKYLISKENNCIVLSLFEGEKFDINKDLQFILIKINEKKPEYENAMRKMIMSLRKENISIKGQLEQLNLDKKSNSVEFLSYPGKPPQNNQNQNQINNVTVQPDKPNPYIKAGTEKIQRVDYDEKAKKKAAITGSLKQIQTRKSLELNISTLANLNYGSYPSVELSSEYYNIIAGFGGNSYNGLIRKSNEDRIKMIADYKLPKPVTIKGGKTINPQISYFAIYDGHGGNKCCNFLQENLHNYIFSSEDFPLYTLKAINSAYIQAENNFFSMVSEDGKLNDKSGSCAVSVLIIDEWCFVINLGDSRALYSIDSGNKLMQITRDQKPNDPTEKERIEKAGGSIYKDDIVTLNGERVKMDEKNLAPGVTLPYRIVPGNLSVARTIGDYRSKIAELGGKPNTVVCHPSVSSFQIHDKSDFILLGCDGIFDRLENDKILHKIWKYKKKGEVHNDIRQLCGKITDGIIKYSMENKTADNVSVVFIAFKNFEKKMKDPDFEYKTFAKTVLIKDKYDFSLNNNTNTSTKK